MSYLDTLLDGADVEWKPLSEVFTLRNGYTPAKSNQEYWQDGTVPWFRMQDLRENGRVLNKAIQYVNTSAVKGGKYFPANSIIIATSATIGEHALITVPFLCNQRFTCLSLKREYTDIFLMKFLFYYTFNLAEWCRNNISVGNFAGVDMNGFKKVLIPIPCPDNPEKSLAIQKEIVRILDTFEKLTAELTAELTARKKQYEYYRNQLLGFKDLTDLAGGVNHWR